MEAREVPSNSRVRIPIEEERVLVDGVGGQEEVSAFSMAESAQGDEGRDGLMNFGLLNSKTGLRRDGRRLEELRPLYMRCRTVTAAAGSAYLSQGETKILCSVFGPSPASSAARFASGEVNVEVEFSSLASSPGGTITLGERKKLARTLQSASHSLVLLHRYPKSVINVIIFILEDEGGVLPAALNCMALALMDAGIATVDVAAAATVYAVEVEEAVCGEGSSDIETSTSLRGKSGSSSSHTPGCNAAAADGRGGRPGRVLLAIDLDRAEQRAVAVGSEVQKQGATVVGKNHPSGDNGSQHSFPSPLSASEQKLRRAHATVRKTTVLHMGFCPSRSSICFLQAVGHHVSGPLQQNLLKLAEAACRAIAEEMRRCVKERFIVKEERRILDAGDISSRLF